MKTLVEKKLVNIGGRKNVVGRPILYKTTRSFLLQFGLKNLEELPSLDEYQELAQASLEGIAVVSEAESSAGQEDAVSQPATATSSSVPVEQLAEDQIMTENQTPSETK